MRSQSTLPAAALLVGFAASPAIALDSDRSSIGGTGRGYATAVPGPIAGAGIGFLVLAGGYYVVRRWRKHNSGE